MTVENPTVSSGWQALKTLMNTGPGRLAKRIGLTLSIPVALGVSLELDWAADKLVDTGVKGAYWAYRGSEQAWGSLRERWDVAKAETASPEVIASAAAGSTPPSGQKATILVGRNRLEVPAGTNVSLGESGAITLWSEPDPLQATIQSGGSEGREQASSTQTTKAPAR